MIANWNGHEWACRWVNDAEFSVVCQNPSFDADGKDNTKWPTDDEVSALAGVVVEITPRRTTNARANIYRRSALVDEAVHAPEAEAVAAAEPEATPEPPHVPGRSNG